MFTVSVIQLVGIIASCLFVGSLFGFFAAAILAVGGQCSDEEEGRPWPGPVER